jgi:CelD/BcsL family acetyltransferase involved in cellulose biosynthesis
MTLSLKIGDETLAWISSEKFMEGWESLLNQCNWSTACQYPDFIIPWYQIYAERCVPVVVAAQSEDNLVTGLLPLALVNNGKMLVGAGMVEAEYQCWIERPENNSDFIKEAIKIIYNAFPSATLHLRYINEGAPLGWVKYTRPAYFHRLQRHSRPLMKLSGSDITARLNSKNNKGKINKLKRTGELSFQRIKDNQAFIHSFDQICENYDSRQREKNSVSPFRDDQLKGKFYIELHRRGILHATILNVGKQMAAFHAGLITRDWLHLGINGQSSDFWHGSPGRIQLLMLGAFLHEENFSTFDLTLGGDEYKEQFETEHDTVFELFLFPGRFQE